MTHEGHSDDNLLKREKYAISLRREKKAQILSKKRVNLDAKFKMISSQTKDIVTSK